MKEETAGNTDSSGRSQNKTVLSLIQNCVDEKEEKYFMEIDR